MNFFVDMDGVLCDFDQGFVNVYGETPCEFKKRIFKLYQGSNLPDIVIEEMFSDVFWKMIDIIPDFWENLPPFIEMIDAVSIFKKDYPDTDIAIISSVPLHQPMYRKAIEGKNKWINKYLEFEMPIIYCPMQYYGDMNKALYCNSRADVLIDDSTFQIAGWNKKGGTGILFNQQMSLYGILEFFQKLY